MSFEFHDDEPPRRPRYRRRGMGGCMMFGIISAPLAMMLLASVIFFVFAKEIIANHLDYLSTVLAAGWVGAALWFVGGGVLCLFLLLSRRRD